MAAGRGSALVLVLVLLASSGLCSSCPDPCRCPSPLQVNCSSAGLSSVPRLLQDSVSQLDLSHNLLDSVALDRPLRRLRSVWLGNNSIAGLSLCVERRRPRRCLSWCPDLRLLSAERNQLQQLPQGLEVMESLQVLQLSFNRISTLRPGDLRHLQQLKELHLQHNLITVLHPETLQGLAQLQILDVSFNMLTSLHPVVYFSLRNIGAEVKLGGNRWRCDCSMRSVRRRMAYDSSRGLQAWRMECDSPSALSGKELLQLEDEDLDCSSPEDGHEHHRDVTAYEGSEILLSCSARDPVWWTPSGPTPTSQTQAGLVISDISETDAGLYVCVSEDHKVVSVYNLQISKMGGARRKTRSLPGTSQMILQVIPDRIGQNRNQGVTQSDLALAVCLSVFITFLVAFILGVLARPCVDRLWKRVTKKKSSSTTHSVSTAEQRQYDNEAFCNAEEPEHMGTRRERRVTFSMTDFREEGNVKYYDTEAAERDAQQSSPEGNRRDPAKEGRSHNMEFEHIPDPHELVERTSVSSDSSLSDKVFNEDQMNQVDHSTPKSSQLAEDPFQQRAGSPTAITVEVPQISIKGTSERLGSSSDPFADWSPHTNNNKLTDQTDPWQESEELFEFSDSVRSTSARSSGAFNDLKLTVAPSAIKQRADNMSSSSSYVSEDEPTQYTVNSDQEEEDIHRNHNKPQVLLDQQNHAVDPIRPPVQNNQGDYISDTQRPALRPVDSFSSRSSDSDGEDFTVKKGRIPSFTVISHSKSLDTRSPAAYSSSSSSASDDEEIKIKELETLSTDDRQGIPQTKGHVDVNATLSASDSSSSHEKQEQRGLPVERSRDESCHPQTQWPSKDTEDTVFIKQRLDVKAPSPVYESSSSSDNEDETTNHSKNQTQGQISMPIIPTKVPQTASYDPQTQWPSVDLDHIPDIKSHLDVKAPPPPPASPSSSDSEDETSHHKNIEGFLVQGSQTGSHDPDTRWPSTNLDNIPDIKRHLDIKALSPASESSSTSHSEDETTHNIKRPVKVDIAELPLQGSQTGTHDPGTRWPSIDLDHIPDIKRRLDVKAPPPPPASPSSSDSEDETSHHKKIEGLFVQGSQTGTHDPGTRWPSIDLEHVPGIKRRLDVKAPSPASESSSSNDSEDETSRHTKKQTQGQISMPRIPSKVPQTASYNPQTQWPSIDLDHIPDIKRRLDVKAPPPPPALPSSSDSEDETSHHKKIEGQLVQGSQKGSHDLDTRWPSINLDHIPDIKRRLNVKAPSAPPDSPSTSHNEDETTNDTKRPVKVDITGPPFQGSQTGTHDPGTSWPSIDLEHVPGIKRRLDVKAPSPASESSSSSDSEDETTSHITKRTQGQISVPTIPSKVPETATYDPKTQWPSIDLDHIPDIKRRLDVKAPPPPPASPSSSDSEDETSHHKKTEGLFVQGSQTGTHDPGTSWPSIDLEHVPGIKRRLDVKAPSPASESSSSNDSEDETSHHTKRPVKVDIIGPPLQGSQTGTHDPGTSWPSIDLEHVPGIKRRLDVKVPSPASESSSTSHSEDETTHNTERPVKVDIAELPLQGSSITGTCDPGTRWPSIDLEHVPGIKRRLDIKVPSPPPASLSSDGSINHPVGGNTEKAIRISPSHSTSSSDEDDVSIPTTVEPDSSWQRQDLSGGLHVKRRLDIKAHSPLVESSSSSDESEGGSTNLNQKVKTVHELSPGVPYINRRLDIKAPQPQPDVLSDSDSEDKHRDHDKLGLGVPATKPKFIQLPNASAINISRSPKSDIKLEKYTVLTDDVKTNENISTTPEINPELQSRWATMNLGFSRYRKRLDISLNSPEPPNVPSSPLPDSPYSSSSESWTGNRTRRNRRRIESLESSLIPRNKPADVSLSLKGQDGNSVEATDRSRTGYSLTNEDKSNPGTTLTGAPQLRRYLDFKVREKATSTPPLKQLSDKKASQSDSVWPPLSPTNTSQIRTASDIRPPSQESPPSSNSEDESMYRSVPNLSLGIPRIKRRLDVKAPLPESSNSSSSGSEGENYVTSNMTDADSSITYKRVIMKAPLLPSNTLYPDAKGQTIDLTKQRHTSLAPKRVPSTTFDDVVKKRIEQPRSATDVNVPAEIRWTGVGRQLSDLPVPSLRTHLGVASSTPAEPELPLPDSSSSESDDDKKEDGRKADVPVMHAHSSPSVPLMSSRALNKFNNPSGSPYETQRTTSADRNERKGLSALRAMSSERRKWDIDENSNKGASLGAFDNPQGDSSFIYEKSEIAIKTSDLSYGVPRYRRHDISDEPPQEAPPPVPATPPPFEAVELTWRSVLSKSIEKSDHSPKLAVYFDSSDTNISEV